MALDISWLNQGLPIFGFALIIFVVYAILAKTKILGDSKAINSIIAIIIALIFITFSSVRTYLLNVTPWFAVLITILFFFFMIIAFMLKTGEWKKFTKPTAIVFIIILGLILIAAIFYTFPSTRALLPGNVISGDYHDYSADYNCDKSYNYDYYESGECFRKTNSDEWKCYYNWPDDYQRYDKCTKTGDEYKCYDFEDYDNSCEYNSNSVSYSSYEGDDVFIRARNWLYRPQIIAAFWLLVVAAIAITVVTWKK